MNLWHRSTSVRLTIVLDKATLVVDCGNVEAGWRWNWCIEGDDVLEVGTVDTEAEAIAAAEAKAKELGVL